ncbi:MAG TPA: cyclic nucleotide-binding domain-containing protein [Acidimicrobiia bacterium]|nr:cyclic nucleotide-binding domain-containing protein [Acidimicrobiia bacterium]
MAGHDRALYTMYLQQVPMLRACSQDEIDHIAELGVTVIAETGQVVVHQGEAGNQFFVIATGSVDVSRDGQKVASLGPGDYFGELALFDPAPRNATVTATSLTTLVSVSRNSFRELLGEISSLRDALLAGMATRLHELDGRV